MRKKPTTHFLQQLCNPFEILFRSVWKHDPNGGHSETTAILVGPPNVNIEAVDWEYWWDGCEEPYESFTLGSILTLRDLPPGKEITIQGHILIANKIQEI